MQKHRSACKPFRVRPIEDTKAAARGFFVRHKALPLYEHGERVLKRACEVNMVEPGVITDASESHERRMANDVLARLILYHTLDYRKASRIPLTYPTDSICDEVMDELEIFTKLTELEHRNAKLPEFVSLLNNGNKPLALLALLADYSVTHETEERLQGFIGSGEFDIFRTYDSEQQARSFYLKDAYYGEKLWAPIAELFGYPKLAGDILRHSYGVNYPNIHRHVNAIYQYPMHNKLLGMTQELVSEIIEKLETELSEAGFGCQIVKRWQKDPGKMMRKMHLMLKDDHEKHTGSTSFDKYLRQNLTSFSLRRIHDWVAIRVIADTYNGEKIDTMPDEQKKQVIDSKQSIMATLVDQVIRHTQDRHSITFESTEPTSHLKPNGYKAYHWDLSPIPSESGITDHRRDVLPFEIQARTTEWHDIAENGKPAHYFYIGGNEGFVKAIAGVYHDIIYQTNGN